MAKWSQLVATGLPAGYTVVVKDSAGNPAVLYPEPDSNAPYTRALTADASGNVFPTVYADNGTYTVAYAGGTKSVTVAGASGFPANPGYVDQATQAELDAATTAGSGTYAPYGVTNARNPLTGWAHANQFGAVGDGTTDDTAALLAAIAALGTGPGTVYLPHSPTGGSYALSAPLVLYNGQNLVGEGIGGGSGAGPFKSVSLVALAGFTGIALVKSWTWDAGGGGSNNWHWGSVDNLRLDCAGIAANGIAVHQMGENAVLRRTIVLNATADGYLLTGAHAPCTLEHANATGCGRYGLNLTSHPAGGAYTGNSGMVRLDGFSGDLNVTAHVGVGGGHSVTLTGWKSESHTVGVHVYASGNANVFASGYYNGTGDVFLLASGNPRVTSVVRSNGATNYINDTVNGTTVLASTFSVPALVTYGGRTVLGNQTVRSRVPQTRTGNGTVTVDASKGDIHEVTLAGNATSCTISNAVAGQEIVLTFIQDGTGSRTYVWPTGTYTGGAAPTNLTAASKRDTVRLIYDGAIWYEISRSQVQTNPSAATPVLSGAYLWAPPSGSLSTLSLANNQMRYAPVFIDRGCTITEVGVEVTTLGAAGSVIRLGIYSGSTGRPSGAPVADWGTVDATTTGIKTITGLTTVITVPGWYFLAAAGQGAPASAPSIRAITGSVLSQGLVPLGHATNASSGLQDAGSVSGALPSANGNAQVAPPVLSIRVT